MKVWEAAVAVLQETNNPAVMWGDSGLLHLIAARAGIPAKDRSWKTEDAVLKALSNNPGDLIEGFTRTGTGRRVRIFRLRVGASKNGMWACPRCGSLEFCESNCTIAPWNQEAE